MRYLALGDSYTIGTGASDESRNYPSIIARHIFEATGRAINLRNPAVNGFTTLDLIRDELPHLRSFQPDLVSILIGVNDLVQGRSAHQYDASLQTIYDAVAALELPAGRTAAISIPNWSVVPAAGDFGDPDQLRRDTDAFNRNARNQAERRGFIWIDITAVSTSGSGTPGWISSDRLHPGDAQYAAWADVVWSRVRDSWVSGGSGGRTGPPG